MALWAVLGWDQAPHWGKNGKLNVRFDNQKKRKK